jgi:hypothetical protein
MAGNKMSMRNITIVTLFALISLLCACQIGSQSATSTFSGVGATDNNFNLSRLKNFQTVTLFFAPGYQYHEEPNSAYNMKMEVLGKAFTSFSNAIGRNNMALWIGDDRRGYVFDILRGKSYADRYGLDYSNGPYIVWTNVASFLNGEVKPSLIISFSQVKPERIAYILNELERQIRKENRVNFEDAKHSVKSEEAKQIILSLNDSIESIGDAVKQIVNFIGWYL